MYCVGKLFSHSLQSLVPMRIHSHTKCAYGHETLQGMGKINFPMQLKYTVLLISSHFEHYGSVSVARAQYKCIGHGPRSCFRSVRSEMKSTVVKLGDCKTWTLDWTHGLDSGLDSWTHSLWPLCCCDHIFIHSMQGLIQDFGGGGGKWGVCA